MTNLDLLYEKSADFRKLMRNIQDNFSKEEAYERERNFVAASKTGLQTWAYLKELIVLLEIEDFCELEYQTMFNVSGWASSLVDNLHNAAIEDKNFAEQKYLFSKEYVDMHEDFLDKELLNLGNVRGALADYYVAKGDLETCDRLYTKWLEQEPDWGWGWIGWSDCYWLFHGKNKQNLIKAKNILERGLEIQKVKSKDVMRERLEELKNRIVKPVEPSNG